jgi:carboxyl-terminal processing protease
MFKFIFRKKLIEENVAKKRHGLLKRISLFIFILVLLFISFAFGMYISGQNKLMAKLAEKETVYLGKITGKYNQDNGGRLSRDVDFNLYWEVWDALKSRYVDKDKFNEKEMFYGSLRGLASSLGDPYTVFFDPKDSQEFSNGLSGTFEGIGAEVGLRDDVITIIAPLSGMPAEKAGIKAGDKIIAIDGLSTASMSVDKAVSKIRGQKDTIVKLTIFREGLKETKDIEIKRDVIYVKSVKTELRADKVFVITISNFNDDTTGLFKDAVREVVKANPRGLIIDLRNNPGGFLDSAVSLASEWVTSGDVVVSEKSSNGTENNKYNAEGVPHLKSYPTVILVNGGSASASEILAGALKDYGLAKIVGEKTYGKGSVQALETLSDGSLIKITVAKWFTPKGNSINEQGIEPDFGAKLTSEDFNKGKDPQLDAAVNVLFGRATSTPITLNKK